MPSSADTNPLASPDPVRWDCLVRAIDPASLLLVVESRLGEKLASKFSAEDVLQDALLIAWRDRGKLEWRGVRAYRAWILTVIDHRIRNLAEQEAALKRGGAVKTLSLSPASESDAVSSMPWEPSDWSTPSRRAVLRERSCAMRRALRELEPQIAEIVRLRVHEELTIDRIAAIVGLDEAAVRRRLRKGAELYLRAFERALGAAGSSAANPLNAGVRAAPPS